MPLELECWAMEKQSSSPMIVTLHHLVQPFRQPMHGTNVIVFILLSISRANRRKSSHLGTRKHRSKFPRCSRWIRSKTRIWSHSAIWSKTKPTIRRATGTARIRPKPGFRKQLRSSEWRSPKKKKQKTQRRPRQTKLESR